MKICAICGNLLEIIFFRTFEWSGFQGSEFFRLVSSKWFFLENVIVRELIKKNLEFALW